MSGRTLLILGAVAAGGALGAVGRHAVGAVVLARAGDVRWVATLLVNLLGCLAIGVLWRLLDHHEASAVTRAFLVAGLLGSFTTFSTFGLDASELLDARRGWLAAVYVGASVAGGLLLVRLGHAITAWWVATGD